LFNLCHAQARNVIKRAFGATKKKFKMFRQPTNFPPAIQARIIVACCNIHNFIRLHDPDDDSYDNDEDSDYTMDDEESEGGEEVNEEDLAWGIAAEETQRAEAKRDEIAMAMWRSYQAELQRRGVSKNHIVPTVICPYETFWTRAIASFNQAWRAFLRLSGKCKYSSARQVSLKTLTAAVNSSSERSSASSVRTASHARLRRAGDSESTIVCSSSLIKAERLFTQAAISARASVPETRRRECMFSFLGVAVVFLTKASEAVDSDAKTGVDFTGVLNSAIVLYEKFKKRQQMVERQRTAEPHRT
jgi:hypothetical protein